MTGHFGRFGPGPLGVTIQRAASQWHLLKDT
jgi:hypothetical protein